MRRKATAITSLIGPILAMSLLQVGACSVDFEGLEYNDDAFAQAQGGDGDAGGAPPGDGDSLCDAFCEDSAETCTFGEPIGYASQTECLDLCAGYTVDEQECRFVHLAFAKDDPEGHCPHTLEDGGGTCPDARPDPCEDFCKESADTCVFGEANAYASEEECLSLCAGYTDEQLECRIVHLVFAADDPAGHCPHTLEDGGGTCPDATM